MLYQNVVVLQTLCPVRPYLARKGNVSFAWIPLIVLETVQQNMYVGSVSQVGIIFQYVISRSGRNRNKKIRKRNVPVQERTAMRTGDLVAYSSNEKTGILRDTATNSKGQHF